MLTLREGWELSNYAAILFQLDDAHSEHHQIKGDHLHFFMGIDEVTRNVGCAATAAAIVFFGG